MYIRAIPWQAEYNRGKLGKQVITAEIQAAQDVWPRLAPVVFVPHAESEYLQLATVLDDLIDVVDRLYGSVLGLPCGGLG